MVVCTELHALVAATRVILDAEQSRKFVCL